MTKLLMNNKSNHKPFSNVWTYGICIQKDHPSFQSIEHRICNLKGRDTLETANFRRDVWCWTMDYVLFSCTS